MFTERSGLYGWYSTKVRQRSQHLPSVPPTSRVAQIPGDAKHRFSREFANRRPCYYQPPDSLVHGVVPGPLRLAPTDTVGAWEQLSGGCTA